MDFYEIENIERIYSKEFDGKKLNRDNDWKLKIAGLQKKLSSELMERQQKINTCPICKSIDFTSFVVIYEFEYCECSGCGHIFCHTPLDSSSIKALYENDMDNPKSIQAEIYMDPAIFNSRVDHIAFPKVKFVSDRIADRGKWLDIGCGIGELVVAANRLGWDASGIESDPDEAEMAITNGAQVTNTFLNADNLNKHVGDVKVISLINVLEHINDPCKFLCSLSNILKKGTWLLIEMPRHPSISSWSNQIFPQHAHRHIYPPDHLHIFTEKSLAIMLEKSQIKPVSMWCFGQDISELFSSLALFNNFVNQNLYNNISSIENKLQSIVDQNNLSDTMIILATKK